MAVVNPPAFMQARTDHSALTHRRNSMTMLDGASLGATEPRGGIHPGYGNRFVTAGSAVAMEVTVNTGLAMVAATGAFNGSYNVYNDALVTLAVDAADATQYRRDIIIVRVKDTAFGDATDVASVEIVKGALSATSPAPLPTMPDRSEALAYISVDPGITNLSGKLADQREYIGSISSIVCTSTARPTTPHEGLIIQETDSNKRMAAYINGDYRFITDMGWRTFTPSVTGWTGVTYSVRSGRWTLVGEKAISVYVEIITTAAGSGTTDIKISMPKTIARTYQQQLELVWEDVSRGVTLQGVAEFAKGSGNGATCDAIRVPWNDTTADLDTIQGAEVGNGDAFYFWGILETTD